MLTEFYFSQYTTRFLSKQNGPVIHDYNKHIDNEIPELKRQRCYGSLDIDE